MSSPVGYPQRNAYPMFSSTSQGDVPVGKNGANLIPVMANVTSSPGGVGSLVVGDTRIQRRVGAGQKSPLPIFGPNMSISDVTKLSGSGTLEIVTRYNRKALKVTIPASDSNIQIQFNALNGVMFGGDLYVAAEGSYLTGLDNFAFYTAPGASISGNYVLNSLTSFQNLSSKGNYLECGAPFTWRSGKSQGQVTGTVSYPFVVGSNKLVAYNRSGQKCVFYIYAFGIGAPKKGRICVMADDGQKSWFRLGAPIYNNLGIPTTAAVIANGVDSFWESSDVMRAYAQSGNALVAHGPNNGLYSDDLFTANANVAGMITDMAKSVEYIKSIGAYVAGMDLCYVWPGGTFQSEYGDLSLLDAAYDAGFRLARCVSKPPPGAGAVVESLTAHNLLTFPYAAHGWAGSTAAQATAISTLVSQIAAVATTGTDMMLVHHQIVPDSTADGAMDATKCRVSDCITLANAVAAAVVAGADVVTMPQLALTLESDSGYWGRIGV